MTRQRLLGFLAIPSVAALFALACENTTDSNPTLPDSSIASTLDGSSPTDSSPPVVLPPPNDAGRDAPDVVDASACRVPLDLWDGGPMLTPTPYREFADSPFSCLTFGSYFYLSTFEGDGGLPPGTTGIGSKAGSSSITDSVDGDDGFPDGGPPDSGTTHPCPTCASWFNMGGMDFNFDESVLGGLPTHAGLVWTDDGNNCTVTFTAYGVDGGVIATQAVPGIGTPGFYGETDEDRFFGVVSPGGVKRITMTHTGGGGMEIDHLQIGR